VSAVLHYLSAVPVQLVVFEVTFIQHVVVVGSTQAIHVLVFRVDQALNVVVESFRWNSKD